ncbi:MAG: Fe(3+) ABC transporter substrate-binding protein [Thermoanaerobaculia bacterium]|nr:Fe(3+) ABC transporter substrate-binding protein [Thermoanaerobaculia bacterium]
MNPKPATVATILTLAATLLPASPGVAAEVNVYSARHYDTDDSLYESFTRQTGIEVNLIEGNSDALLARLEREGERSPADVFMTVDAGRLYQAEERGFFAPTRSEVLESRIPASLRHPDGLWFGLTKRARLIFVAKDRVAEGAIGSYEDLADPRWKGKVLIRSSSNVYNQSLVGSMIEAHGEAAAEAWCRGLVANFSRPPQGGDRDQIRAVAAGEGDVAVANSYYYARMLTGSPEDQAAARAVRVVFPNQGDRGTHVNISGIGVLKSAPHPDAAVRFIEYLTSPEAQRIFAAGNNEYPVVEGAELAPVLEQMGDFEEDALNASVFGRNNQAAVRMMDRAGWR